ncbi:MAG: hypothetical protein IRZ31_05310 [Thermogemmatispora sp.]|nr:hypothetical protein [Thermogemmatispora sp.]MBX5456300.1 hypothetical protein [Thermogemmatispora sp.]
MENIPVGGVGSSAQKTLTAMPRAEAERGMAQVGVFSIPPPEHDRRE